MARSAVGALDGRGFDATGHAGLDYYEAVTPYSCFFISVTNWVFVMAF